MTDVSSHVIGPSALFTRETTCVCSLDLKDTRITGTVRETEVTTQATGRFPAAIVLEYLFHVWYTVPSILQSDFEVITLVPEQKGAISDVILVFLKPSKNINLIYYVILCQK